MRKLFHRAGNFYKSIMMKYIGIFIFTGILFVVFNKHGWFPNQDIYAISQLVYDIVLPCLIGYGVGSAISTESGGMTALLGTIGVVAANSEVGLFGAMVMGALGGFLCKRYFDTFMKRVKPGMHMLVKNLITAILGTVLTLTGFYLVTPALLLITREISGVINYLMVHKLIVCSHILTEPAKVLFLNNSVNHGVLVPLGLQQLQETGSSILFLIETNPGPGFGILTALYVMSREKREQYLTGMLVQAIGGIHEVYFPFVLSNIWLLTAAICGGMAGTFCFLTIDAGVNGVASPGSVITILLMAGKDSALGVLAGIIISAAVSFAVSILILYIQNQKKSRAGVQETIIETEHKEHVMVREALKGNMPEEEQKMSRIHKIGFVCDAGVGSSVMGAALLRKKLAGGMVKDVEVQAFAADQIEPGMDLLVCQKDFLDLFPGEAKRKEIYVVDHFLNSGNYEKLVQLLKERNG